MNWLRFFWHRFLEYRHQLRADRLFALGRRHHDAAMRHGAEADRIRSDTVQDVPREWKPRLWARGGDARSEDHRHP